MIDSEVAKVVAVAVAKVSSSSTAVPETPVLITGLVSVGLVKVLLVKVSVVALPTKVSVEVGKVNVPVLTMEPMTGVVNVLFVSVCVPVRVATVESIETVKVLEAPTVSIPVPPAIVNVSLSKSIDNAPPLSP